VATELATVVAMTAEWAATTAGVQVAAMVATVVAVA
jgi:hypothetical protein